MLKLLLKIDEDEDWDGEHHVEDNVRAISVTRFDPSVENKHLDVTHIDFKLVEAIISERVIFFKHVQTKLSCVSGGLRVVHVRWSLS